MGLVPTTLKKKLLTSSVKVTAAMCLKCSTMEDIPDTTASVTYIKKEFTELNSKFIKRGVSLVQLYKACAKSDLHGHHSTIWALTSSLLLCVCVLYHYNFFDSVLNYGLGVRCVIPNNYFVWEATRPVSNCEYCNGVSSPIILLNVSRQEFAPHAYSSKPIVIKKAFAHWEAMTLFNYTFFKNLYEQIEGAYESVDEECQFLHFKSDFISLRDVFHMDEDRVNNLPGQKSWYVGWGNCHTQVLQKMRQHYPKPHFLPEDCEIPSKEYVFMGYDAGATMHLDFINRLMWQAQLKGTKTWLLKPSPECDDTCQSFSFLVEPGDAVLVDTRVWYHGTFIRPGEFSLSIQSEYG